MTYLQAAYLGWVLLLVSWHIAMIWTSEARAREAGWRRAAYLAGFVVGFALLFAPPRGGSVFGLRYFALSAFLPESWRVQLWAEPSAVGWALVAAEAAAFAFAWWARVHLGKLWSGMITLREDHRVVDTGPYRLARHPIYTGYIGASWALALIAATPAALLGAAILTLNMAVKAKNEESFLRRELGAKAYDAYAARTPMLIPFTLV